MRFRSIIVCLAIVAIFAIVGAYFRFTPFALTGVDVATDMCEHSLSYETVVQSEWVGPTYRVAIGQTKNCGLYQDAASVQRLGSHLFVRTIFTFGPSSDNDTDDDGNEIPMAVPACNCQHRTILSIPGLPQQSYKAHVYSWP